MTPEAWGWVSLTQTTGTGWFPRERLERQEYHQGAIQFSPFMGSLGGAGMQSPGLCRESASQV